MQTHTLLIADDSLTIQRVIQLTFADGPIRVVVAADGQQALDMIAADRPDIVLAGTSLPGVDGYAIARKVSKQRRLRKLPVLLLTSRFEANDEAKIKESGAKGILEKPLAPGVIMARVKHALGIKETPEPVAERAVNPPKPARKPPARKPPVRRRRIAAAQLAPTIAWEQPMGAFQPEVLAQLMSAAAAHAIAAFDQSRGGWAGPAMPPAPGTPGLRAAQAGSRFPKDSWAMPPQHHEAGDLRQLQREMGLDEFEFDLAPSVLPAGPVNDREPAGTMGLDTAVTGGPAMAQEHPQEPAANWDQTLAEWLSSEMRVDHVKRTVPPWTGTTDLRGDVRTAARARSTATVAPANRILEPVRLALNGLGALPTRLRETWRGADGQAWITLGGLAHRCRSVFASMI